MAPKFDTRTSREVFRELLGTLTDNGWLPRDEKKGSVEALAHVCARFAELVIHRLNRAPDKNFLAFLDLLGVSQLPMQAARVPLTFLTTPGTVGCVTVPAGSQFAAPPPEGEKKPIIFETERELILTPAKLDLLLSKSGERDEYRDIGSSLQSALVTAGTDSIEPSISDSTLIPHVFYIALPVNASWPKIDSLRIQIALAAGTPAGTDPCLLQWELPAGNLPPLPAIPAKATSSATAPKEPATQILSPHEDTTKNLSQGGDVVFKDFPLPSAVAIEGTSGHWLGCRLLTPITQPVTSTPATVRGMLPEVKQITCEMDLSRQGLAIDQAFYNAQKLDLSKDFFPFGERPKFGDVLYLSSKEVFSDADAKITLHVDLTNPEAASTGVGIPNTATHNTELSWEFWNGQAWTHVGKTGRFPRIREAASEIGEREFTDGTKSLSNNGDVSFQFSSPPQPLIINGQKNFWIRVRIAAGSYGEPFHFEKDSSPTGMVAKPATLAPPSIRSIKIDYGVKKIATPTALITYNDFFFAHAVPGSSFTPFIPLAEESIAPSVYFGFRVDGLATQTPNPQAASKNGIFPRRTVTAYIAAKDTDHSDSHRSQVAPSEWQYWNGSAWTKLSVRDETLGLRRSGLVQFIPPSDFVTQVEFGNERYWLRLYHAIDGVERTIRCVELNTTTAIQGISVVNDLLGTSNGKASQKFQTIQPMVLAGQKLEVREPTLPPRSEREAVQSAEGPDSIQTVNDPATQTEQYWVTWKEVLNFYASRPRDRHYVLDHAKGEVTFGDGNSGLIPPVLPGNVRMKSYRSGGGSHGNVDAGAITKLISAIPSVQKVFNSMPASGGSDEEEQTRMLERGSRAIRHGQRAVTAEDYEDLAMLASREVARARSVPYFDLSVPLEERTCRPGVISVIVLPSSSNPQPTPTAALLDCVRDYLDRHRLPTTELVVSGPEYIAINLDAEIAVNDIDTAHDVEVAVNQALQHYLHPVSGGLDGNGWEFGELPGKFDLTVLIEGVRGVGYVRDLRINLKPAAITPRKTRHLMVCPGHLRITTILEERSAVEFA